MSKKKVGYSVPDVNHIPVLWLVVAIFLATVLRCTPWYSVFTPDGIHFLFDGDPYYHVLRAKQLAIDHQLNWSDPALNHPFGSLILWPPLYDALIAASAWVVDGLHPSPRIVETCAAILPVLLGVAVVGAGTFLAAEFLGGSAAIIVAFLLAVLPVHVKYGVVGRPDQHILESLFLILLLITYLRSFRETGSGGLQWRHPLLFGLILSLSLWTWVGSPLHLIVLASIVAVGYVLSDDQSKNRLRGVKVVGAGSATASVMLALAASLFGPLGALGVITLKGVSLFHVILTAVVAAWCGLLLAVQKLPSAGRGFSRRTTEVLAISLLCITALFVVSADLRAALLRGFLALNRGNEWYEGIKEFQPLLFGANSSLPSELKDIWSNWGLIPLLASIGVIELFTFRWALHSTRPKLIVLACYGVIFTTLLFYMSRFGYYSVIPLAIFAALGILRIVRLATPKIPKCLLTSIIIVLALGPCVSSLLPSSWTSQKSRTLATVLSPIRQGGLPSSGGVIARWDMGHQIRYYSGLPVVASPFGTDGGEGSMEDTSAFFLEEDGAAAKKLLQKRKIKYVLLEDPANAVLESIAFTQHANPPVKVVGDRFRGFTIKCLPIYDRLIVTRLFYYAGAVEAENNAALGGFRLVNEVGPPGGPPIMRLFEVVEGANVNVLGAKPGAQVIARTQIKTPLGVLPWVGSAIANASGNVQLQLPYSTGSVGNVAAGAYLVSDGISKGRVVLSNEDVLEGRSILVFLEDSVLSKNMYPQ